MKVLYPSTLNFSPSLTLNTPFPLYLSIQFTFAEFYLHPSPFTPSMLLSMTNVDESDSSLLAFQYRKIKGM